MGLCCLKNLTFTLLITLLLWTSSTFTATNAARRGRHWKHKSHNNREADASLYKKKGKTSPHGSHNQKHHHHFTKPVKIKPPYYRTPSPPKAQPKPKPISKPAPAPAPPSLEPVVGQPKPKPISKPAPAPAPPSLEPVVAPPSTGPYKDISESTFNVLSFGAMGDGRHDDTKAFEAAWASACKVEASTILVPSGYQFYVGPISFSGPYCQQNILFQLDGAIIAPTSPMAWGSPGVMWWLEFTKLKGITIQGTGTIDGSGSVWWEDYPYDENPIDDISRLINPLNNTIFERPPRPVRSELSQKMPRVRPTALRFYGSFNVTVTGITIRNSPQCHLKFDNCIGVSVHGVDISSPGDSPNTDGVHLQNSRDVLIHTTNVACGDDCVSIGAGSSNIYIHNVNCGPGHGISIGSLGKDNTKACVSNITVRDVMMHNTMTGVRIKTWQGGSGSVQGILFSNIQMSEVQLPIVIDQFYCDKSTCKNETTAVAVSGVTYKRVRGTYTVKPVHFACSDNLPCTDVTLTAIQLKPLQERYRLYDPFCWQTFGLLSDPIVPPVGCLQVGKPAKSHLQSELDLC